MPRFPAPDWFFPGQEVFEIATGIQWRIISVTLEPPSEATDVTAILMDDDRNIANIPLADFNGRFSLLEDMTVNLPATYYGVSYPQQGGILVQVFNEGHDFRDVRILGSSREVRISSNRAFHHLPDVFTTETTGLGRSFTPGDILLYDDHLIGIVEVEPTRVFLACDNGILPTRRILGLAVYQHNGRDRALGAPIPEPSTPPTQPSPPRMPSPAPKPIVRKSAFERLTEDDDL